MNTLRKTLARRPTPQTGEGIATDYRDRIQAALEAPSRPALHSQVQERLFYARQSAPAPHVPEQPAPLFALEQKRFSRLQVLGQWHSSYLLCEDPHAPHAALLLIDQHAAHERIGYERYKKAYKENRLATQPLLISEPLEFSAFEHGLLSECIPQFKLLGIELEPFGETTLLVRSIPALLKGVDLKALFKEILNDLQEFGSSQSLEDRLDLFLITFSCHTMVRANHRLEPQEMRALLADLDTIDFSVRCPHGRPVCVEIALSEIEKRFGRT